MPQSPPSLSLAGIDDDFSLIGVSSSSALLTVMHGLWSLGTHRKPSELLASRLMTASVADGNVATRFVSSADLASESEVTFFTQTCYMTIIENAFLNKLYHYTLHIRV